MTKTLGERIRELRAEKDLSLREFAKKLGGLSAAFLSEIERICTEELHAVGLYPSRPEPVRVERFIEKRFNVSATYEELPPGVLGYTRFNRGGVEAIVVSCALCDEGTRAAERRINTTLA